MGLTAGWLISSSDLGKAWQVSGVWMAIVDLVGSWLA